MGSKLAPQTGNGQRKVDFKGMVRPLAEEAASRSDNFEDVESLFWGGQEFTACRQAFRC